jgi:SET domain-containing protein
MQHTQETCIDATNDCGIGRKINHSRLLANCATRIEQVGSAWRVFLYATKLIKAGTELTYDYKLADCTEDWANK